MIRSLVLLFFFFVIIPLPHRLDAQTTQQPGSQPPSVVGIVTNAQSGKPLAGVHVQLTRMPGEGGMVSIVYGAISKSDGRFSISAIETGQYLLGCQSPGLVLTPANQASDRIISIKTGGHLQLNVRMIPSAVISGRVVNEFGDPLPDVYVRVEPVAGSRVMRAYDTVGQANTDDRGVFRFRTSPGKYRLKAEVSRGTGGSREIRTDGTVSGTYREMYYPGVTSADAAAIIEVKAGENRGGLDVQLTPTPVFNIGGAVSGIPEGRPICSLWLGTHNSNGGESSTETSLTNWTEKNQLNENFFIGRLSPGEYRISVRCQKNDDVWYSQIESITLSQSDVNNVSLVLAPAEDVTGVLEPNNLWHGPLAGAARTIRLEPEAGGLYDRVSKAQVAPDGTFTLKQVATGRYRVAIEPLPENGFVESIELNESPNSGSVVEIPEEGAKLRVKISAQGAQLTGTVKNQKGDPVPLLAMVLLSPVKSNFSKNELILSHVDGNGKYKFAGVPPGKYRLLSIGFANSVGDWNEALKNAGARVQTIDLKKGDKVEQDIQLWSSGESNAASQ
jgi:hypothetical protein